MSVSTLAVPHAFHSSQALCLRLSGELLPFSLAYDTYGELNPHKSNAILVCHALTGDAHAAGYYEGDDPAKTKSGWWDGLIGPGKALDTDRYFVICSNVLGGCKGSTGPASLNPNTGKAYGMSFPLITVGDMVDAQHQLMQMLGIERWLCILGGSLGGFQALEWAVSYPQAVASVVGVATAARTPVQALAFNAVGRHAIMSDPLWQNGEYDPKNPPVTGLSTARMMAHITYLSEASLERKFGRRRQSETLASKESLTTDNALLPEFAVESYLSYQGSSFIKRFDANTYLYLTKAMDYFDLAADYGTLQEAMRRVEARMLLLSYSSDWLFPTEEARQVAKALRQNAKQVSFLELASNAGHDAFLLELDSLTTVIKPFLAQTFAKEAAERGLDG